MHHWDKKLSIKNWKTGEILEFNSQTEFCKKYNIPIQVCSDIVNHRRKYYKQFCLPSYTPDFFKVSIVNLKTNKVLKFKNMKQASKILHLGIGRIEKLHKHSGYRFKHFSHIKFSSFQYIPLVRFKSNGAVTKVYDYKDLAKKMGWSAKHAYYFLNQKRISADDKIEVLDSKNYKYLIHDKKKNKTYPALKLNNFSIKNGMYESILYRKNKRFEVIEG